MVTLFPNRNVFRRVDGVPYGSPLHFEKRKSVRRLQNITFVELALMRIFKQSLCIISLLVDFSGGTPALTQCVHTGKTNQVSEQTSYLALKARTGKRYFSVSRNHLVTPVKGDQFPKYSAFSKHSVWKLRGEQPHNRIVGGFTRFSIYPLSCKSCNVSQGTLRCL